MPKENEVVPTTETQDESVQTEIDPAESRVSDFYDEPTPEEKETEDEEDSDSDETSSEDNADDSNEDADELDLEGFNFDPQDEARVELESEEEGFSIDEDLAKDLPPEKLKRLEDHLKGAAKVLKKNAELTEMVAERDEQLRVPMSYINGLSDPVNAPLVAKQLLLGVAKTHGVDFDQLMQSVYSGDPLSFEAPSQPQQDPQIAALKREIEEIKQDRTERQKQDTFNAYIKAAFPLAQGRLSKDNNGFTITRDQFAEAVKKYPEYQKKPWLAVERHLGPEIKSHLLNRKAGKPGVRKMTESTKGASQAKEPYQANWRDYIE
jgi:hypothetical protein